MEELQAAIHKHLGESLRASRRVRCSSSESEAALAWSPGTKKYTMFKQSIGSKQTKLGFHGMIALTIFGR
jgi:hypothetical protein